MPEHGGKRTPGNPAPVSGPGQLSQRTDGGPQQVLSDVSGLAYGENQGLEDLQSAAPLNASGQTTARATRRAPSRRAGGRAGGMGASPLMVPTKRPDEPVTAGAPVGPGPGPMQQQVPPRLTGILQRMTMNDPSGDSEALLAIAQRLGY